MWISALALGIPGAAVDDGHSGWLPATQEFPDTEAVQGGATPLANMFLRIWLFGLYLASLESFLSRSHRSDLVHLPGGGDRPALFVAISNDDIARFVPRSRPPSFLFWFSAEVEISVFNPSGNRSQWTAKAR